MIAVPQKLHNPLDKSGDKKQKNFNDAESETILREAGGKKAAVLLWPHTKMMYGRRS